MENHIVRMRASPAVGVGGMYATGEGLDEVIRTFSATPPFFERQNVSATLHGALLSC